MKQKLLRAFNLLKNELASKELERSFAALKSAIDSMPEESQEIIEFPMPKDFTGDFAIFSDGGCRGNPGPGAWAMIVQNQKGDVVEQESGFSPNTTNNQMELLGVIEGLKYLIGKEISRSLNVTVYSDSKYVVDGMNSWVEGWKQRDWRKADKKPPENLELWQQLDQLRESFAQIKFKWVKGHSGHPQNEHCDNLLNQCMDESTS